MTALFDAQVWYTDGDDEEAVRGEGEAEYIGSLAHIFKQLQADEHRIRLVDIHRMSR
jgi:hypothetical protein